MVKTKSASKKKIPAAPLGITKPAKTVTRHPLLDRPKKNYGIGRDVLPKGQKDLSRYVKWPLYIRLQRQKRVLYKRLKVPPAINQFNCTIDRDQASALFRILNKYRPESEAQKKKRLVTEAEARAGGKSIESKKPIMLKYGINHIADLVEMRKAKLVVIAHDVDPIELVVWLPTLCRKKDVPYCIIKGKSRLGKLVHKKTSCAICVDNIRKEDHTEFEKLCNTFRAQFNDNVELRRNWGGGILGIKAYHAKLKAEKAVALENAKKLGLKV